MEKWEGINEGGLSVVWDRIKQNFVSSIGFANNQMTWSKGGVAQTPFTVGYASLATDTKTELLTGQEFAYRQTAGGGLTYNPSSAVLKRVLGNSLAFNQLMRNGDFSIANEDFYYNSSQTELVSWSNGIVKVKALTSRGAVVGIQGTTNIKTINGHKYYSVLKVKFETEGSLTTKPYINAGYSVSGTFYLLNRVTLEKGSWVRSSAIWTATADLDSPLRLNIGNYSTSLTVGDYISYDTVMVIDLTLMFGAGNEPATPEAFEALFPDDYYAYNEGTLINNAARGLQTRDADEKEVGYLPLNLNAFQVKDAQGNVTTINGLKQAGTVRDEIVGRKYIQRIGVQLLGDVSSSNIAVSDSTNKIFRIIGLSLMKTKTANLLMVRYLPKSVTSITNMEDMSLAPSSNAGYLFFRNTSCENKTAFISAISNDYLYYELATPIEYEIVDALPTTYPIDVLGTERMVSDTLCAPFTADIQYGAKQRDVAYDINNLHTNILTIKGRTSVLEGYFTAGVANNAARLSNTSAIGSATQPVYFDANGVPAQCSTYAGGTAVTLNGSSKEASTASFYAPTSAGTSGQVLTSSGGAPSWTDQSSLSVGTASKLGSSTVGAANRPIYLNAGTATQVDSVGEAFLSWGGEGVENTTQNPVNTCLIPELRNNLAALVPASNVTIEYSRDSGTTWVDYEATDEQKTGLFTEGNSSAFRLGKESATSGVDYTQYLLRVTFDTANFMYRRLLKFAVRAYNVSGTYYCTIDTKTNTSDTWTTRVNKGKLANYFNVYNTSSFTTYYNSSAGSAGARYIRFTFGCDAYTSSSIRIYSIYMFGNVCYGTSYNQNNLVNNGHIYSFDTQQNATFPAGVSATTFTENGTALSSKYLGINDNAVSATKATNDSDGNAINTTYFKVSNFTKANIKSTLGISDWALAANKPSYAFSEITGTVTNAQLTNSKVTIAGTDVSLGGSISATTLKTNLGLGASAYLGYDTTVTKDSTSLITSGAVWTAFENLPEPMVFKGSLGTGGTITSLPTNGSASIGDTYKVITAGTYASKAAKVGDTFICLTKTSSANTWELIPSGDEPSGTVTSVGLSMPTGFSVSSSPVTSSGTLTVSFASGYSLPTTAKQGNWDTAYTHATDASRLTTAKSSGFYMFATTAEGHIASVTAVEASDLTTLIGNTTYAPYNATGYQVKVSKLGSATKPLYTSAAGTFAECSTYAGGTAVTLNGTSKAASTASFYAPTGAGTSGQILKSSGSGAPTWVNQSTLTAGALTTVSKTAWGRTYWTANGVPDDISGDMDGVGIISINNQQAIRFKKYQSDDFLRVLVVSVDNNLYIGPFAGGETCTTYIYGKPIIFRTKDANNADVLAATIDANSNFKTEGSIYLNNNNKSIYFRNSASSDVPLLTFDNSSTSVFKVGDGSYPTKTYGSSIKMYAGANKVASFKMLDSVRTAEFTSQVIIQNNTSLGFYKSDNATIARVLAVNNNATNAVLMGTFMAATPLPLQVYGSDITFYINNGTSNTEAAKIDANKNFTSQGSVVGMQGVAAYGIADLSIISNT